MSQKLTDFTFPLSWEQLRWWPPADLTQIHGTKTALKLAARACYNLPYSAVRVDELWCPRASLNRPSAPLDTGAGGFGAMPLQSELGEQLG